MIRLSPPSDLLKGRVMLPYSKSMLNRQLVLSHLAGGAPVLDEKDERFARDSLLLTKALYDLREGNGDLQIKDAGTAMRFMTAVCSITTGEWTLSGTERMHRRPISPLVDSLRKIDADITYAGGDDRPPLRINGRPLKGGRVGIRGDVSSQFISALLMIGGCMTNGLEIIIDGAPLSRPYIEMTLDVMTHHGMSAEWQADMIRVRPRAPSVSQLVPESDWSAAAFWYAILAVAGTGELVLPGLVLDSPQGDKACVQIFDRLGVCTETSSEGLVLRASDTTIERFETDCRDYPDLAQSLAFCCAAKGIACHLSGLETLPGKETDRIAAIKTELAKLGVECRTDERSLSFEASELDVSKAVVLSTYDDHRMAMAMSCLAVRSDITLDDGTVVAKSYPAFFKELEKVGFAMTRENKSA